MNVVGWHLRIPASEVFGAATSYTELRLPEPGRRVLRVCTGLGCRLSGGATLLGSAAAELGIEPGQTTPDGSVTLEEIACGFLCGVAPVVQWDGTWKGRVGIDELMGIVRAEVKP